MRDPKEGAANATTELPTSEVELLKSHTHEGKTYEKGAKIKVDESTADWLRAQHVIA